MPLDLAPIKARLAAATGGEWYEETTTFGRAIYCRPPDDGDGYLALVEGSADRLLDHRHHGFLNPHQLAFVVRTAAYAGRTAEEAVANADFIVHAHNHDVPALIAEVERLRALLPPTEEIPDA